MPEIVLNTFEPGTIKSLFQKELCFHVWLFSGAHFVREILEISYERVYALLNIVQLITKRIDFII